MIVRTEEGTRSQLPDSLNRIMQNRTFRLLVLLLFCIVGVLQIRQFAVNPKQAALSPYKQEVQDVKIVKIKTMTDRGFCVAANVIQGEIDEFERITLLLHVSSDRLNDKVLRQVQNWNGPISLSVAFPEGTGFNSTRVKCAIDMLLDLQVRDENVRRKLSVHFLSKNVTRCNDFMLHGVSKIDNVHTHRLTVDQCTPKKENLTADQLAEKFVNYPVNRARNVARKFAMTKYILSADMDHHFSEGFEEKMLELAENHLEKDSRTVLVYRIFEVSKKAKSLPKTKEDLLKLYIEGTAQEFHKYYGAHSIPRLYEWFMHPETKYSTEIQFYKPYTSHHWEPQFVSLNNIPEHDESFMYSVRDNTCLRWEMCRAGFKFAIVHNVFMYHPGFKEQSEISVLTKARRIVGRKQKQIVAGFNKRLDSLYKTTKKTCPNYD